jgi:hypothetical protein
MNFQQSAIQASEAVRCNFNSLMWEPHLSQLGISRQIREFEGDELALSFCQGG